MIPFAILSCQIQKNGYENQEVRILDLSEESFTFRLVRDLSEENAGKMDGASFILHFFRFQESRYQEVVLSEYQLEVAEEQEFYILYRLITEDAEYHRYAGDLMKEYMRYISLKLNEDDGELSKALTGYPAEREEKYAADFATQKKRWFAEWNGSVQIPDEFAISLDNPFLCEKYLELPMKRFAEEYWRRNGLEHHPLAQKRITHLYIGNQFCHLLFPEEEMLFALLEKAEREQVEVVLVFTYMQEVYIKQMEDLMDALKRWWTSRSGYRKDLVSKHLELVINDWGMLSLIRAKKYDCFKLTLGVLLQKHRKDVRIQYKQGFQQHENQLKEGAVHGEFYREYLENHFGIERISYEACGYPVKTAPGKASLHLPFYQMNTSQHCTLYARCHNGARGKQSAVKSCPGYCRDLVFLYPEMLHMVGRYNSLFGYDETVLRDEKVLQSYLEQGVDRIVMELL